MNKICFGCGAKLQSVDKEKIGYIPENKLDNSSYCMRCFRMIHYGEQVVVNTPKDKKEIVNKINKDNKFVIFLVDFLNINKDIMDFYKSIKKEKLLVINKCELIPKHVKKENFRKYIKEEYGINGEIKLKGGTITHGAKSILNYLGKNNIKETYVVGITNAGKSTLINDLIKETNTDVSTITVNNKKNTTIDFIRVKLKNEMTLIDSPGIVFDDFISNDVVDKNIEAITFNMKENETLSIFDNKFYIKVTKPTSLTIYTNVVARKIAHKVFKKELELNNNLKLKSSSDIVLKGLGFISVKNETDIETNIDSKYIEVRNSMFGRVYENSSNE